MTTAQLQVKEIRANRTIHEIVCGLAYYNYEGVHWRVFKSFNDAKAYVLDDDETIEILFETEEEEELENYLEGLEVGVDQSKLEKGLKNFHENGECPHCGSSDYDTSDEEVDGDSYFRYFTCEDCEGTWMYRYSADKIEANGGEDVYFITSEEEDVLARENKAMGDFLEKQLGFTQENVSDIANSGSKLYCVHVVCDNELKSYKLYTKIEEAHAYYIKLCKKWYSDAGLEQFRATQSDDDLVSLYDSYYGSEEHLDACDNAHVTWEVLNDIIKYPFLSEDGIEQGEILQSRLEENNMFFRVGDSVVIDKNGDFSHRDPILEFLGKRVTIKSVDEEKERYKVEELPHDFIDADFDTKTCVLKG